MTLMALVDFACPHCSGQFQLENPPLGGQVACPLCRQMLAIPSELPPDVADSDAAAPVTSPSESETGEHPHVETREIELDVADTAGHVPRAQRRTRLGDERVAVEPLSRIQKEHRRQVRSLVWMIGGAVLLAIAAAVLSRL
jgi:hypothetical protein